MRWRGSLVMLRPRGRRRRRIRRRQSLGRTRTHFVATCCLGGMVDAQCVCLSTTSRHYSTSWPSNHIAICIRVVFSYAITLASISQDVANMFLARVHYVLNALPSRPPRVAIRPLCVAITLPWQGAGCVGTVVPWKCHVCLLAHGRRLRSRADSSSGNSVHAAPIAYVVAEAVYLGHTRSALKVVTRVVSGALVR